MRIVSVILFLLILYFFPGISNSQGIDTAEYNLDELKIIGDRINYDRFDAPGKIQVIDEYKIQSKNGGTLSDILQLSGNIFVKSYGGNYSLNTISMNGLGSEHTLILLNGFKLNSNQNNLTDLNTITKDNIEQVEVLNNGYSSVYGPEAIGGVINIITKNKPAKNFLINLQGEVGSFNQRKIFTSLQKSFNNLTLIFNYSSEASKNNYSYYFNNGVEKIQKKRDNSEYDNTNFSLNLNYKYGAYSRLNLYSSFSNLSRRLPGIEAGSEPANAEQQDESWNNILSFESNISENFSLKSQLNFQNNLSRYEDFVLVESYYKNLVAANSTQLDFIKKNIMLTAGFDLSLSKLMSNETYNDIKRIQPGIFLVSQIDLNDNIIIYPSARYDHISDINRDVVSGKVGLNMKLFKDRKINFKASAGNNFAAPTFNELYWKDIGNKNLRPEKSFNFDAGIISEFDILTKGIIEITYTYIDAKDKIVWSPDSRNIWSPKNIGKSGSHVFSMEASIKKKFSPEFLADFSAGYSYTKSLKKSKDYETDPTFEKQIFYIPENLLKLNFSLQYRKAGLNLFYNFTGKRFTDMENKNYLPAVNVFEGNVYQKFYLKRLSVQAKLEVNNIFNEDYQMVSGYPMPLRNYKFILSLEY